MNHDISGPKAFQFKGHNYFYSGHVPAHANQKVDWLDARNICREYCMDLVSMETQEENNMIFRLIQQSEYKFVSFPHLDMDNITLLQCSKADLFCRYKNIFYNDGKHG